jgi:hypothetical protein
MSRAAWLACSLWIAAAAVSAVAGARRGLSEGRGRRAAARLKRPTVYLFTGYLVLAALVTPASAGESGSPLLGLGVVIPVGYVLATLAAIGREQRRPVAALGLAALHGGAVLAAAAVVLAVASPAFVPSFLR